MTTTTFENLEAQRIKWNPKPLIGTSYDLPEETGIADFVYRAIALGLFLELPVGMWVNEARKQLKNMPEKVQNDALHTLAKNIQDETVHYKAFTYAAKAYPKYSLYEQEAEQISRHWEFHSDNPLLLAAVAETAVFIPSLAILRLYGGDSMSTLAADVSRDEYRHVATNRAVLSSISTPLHKVSDSVKEIQESTLRWLVGDFQYKSLGIDFDWLNEQADELLYTGAASELEELTVNAEYRPPFENTNKYSY